MIPKPFTNMAVSLSGGGYRATTFHLGALSYLNHAQFNGKSILEEVKIISTISGGTFTGAMYALRLAQGKTFDDCFHDLYEILLKDQLVDLALHKLSNPSKWANPHKSKDLINAFSEVYNEVIFNEATFEELYTGRDSHLTDIIFGSSEFTDGIQFRFQQELGQGKFGNFYLNLPKEAAHQVRIADAVAASSCFPGGFEPLIMPIDFGNGPDSKVDKAWTKKRDYPNTALMDGGIIDNQGIEGVKLAERRHQEEGKPHIGTYIVSDVSGEFMQPYKVPILKEGGIKNFITINGINIFAAVALIVISCILTFSSIGRIGTIILSSFLPLIVIWFALYFYAKSQLSAFIKESFGPHQLKEYLKDFRILIKTPVYILLYLIKFRISSVMKMVSDVFMRRIRRLSLDSLYDSDDWNYRFKSNYIYTLKKEIETLKKEEEDFSEEMQDIINAANSMPTTLWFTEKEIEDKVLDDLIICGQFTQCYNLKQYLERIMTGAYKDKVWDSLDQDYKDKLIDLKDRIDADWKEFKNKPKWLFDDYFSYKPNLKD